MNKGLGIALAAALTCTGCLNDDQKQKIIDRNVKKINLILGDKEEVLIINSPFLASSQYSCTYDGLIEVENKEKKNGIDYTLTSSQNLCRDQVIGYTTDIRTIIGTSPMKKGIKCKYLGNEYELITDDWLKYDTHLNDELEYKEVYESWIVGRRPIKPAPVITLDYSKCWDDSSIQAETKGQ